MVLNQESGINLDRLSYSALSNFTTTDFAVPVGNMKDISIYAINFCVKCEFISGFHHLMSSTFYLYLYDKNSRLRAGRGRYLSRLALNSLTETRD